MASSLNNIFCCYIVSPSICLWLVKSLFVSQLACLVNLVHGHEVVTKVESDIYMFVAQFNVFRFSRCSCYIFFAKILGGIFKFSLK